MPDPKLLDENSLRAIKEYVDDAKESVMTPSFVGQTTISSRTHNPSPIPYGGLTVSGTFNTARFYVGTVGVNSNGIYVMTYGYIMLMFVVYGLTANQAYYTYGARGGTTGYNGAGYIYYIDSSGYLNIYIPSNSSNYLPSGWTVYLHKLKLY